MVLTTKYFGDISYQPDSVLHFPSGLFGFEEEREFLLLPFHYDGDGGLLCFQSITTPALAFIAMNPFHLKPDYAPVLDELTLIELGVSTSQELCYYVLCVVKKPVSESTVNLRCPVVINDQTRMARQVILDTDIYEMRHPLLQFERGGGAGRC